MIEITIELIKAFFNFYTTYFGTIFGSPTAGIILVIGSILLLLYKFIKKA